MSESDKEEKTYSSTRRLLVNCLPFHFTFSFGLQIVSNFHGITGLELQPRGNLTLNLQSQLRKLPIVPCSGSMLSPMNQWTNQGVSIIVQKEMIKSS